MTVHPAEPSGPGATSAWFVDSSVLLRAILGHSAAAKTWFETAVAGGDALLGSRMLEVETCRTVRNRGLDLSVAVEYLDEFTLLSIDDPLLDEAVAIEPPCGGADSIHLAAALRLGRHAGTLVTHDAQMSRAGTALGFPVHDPVTDDPHRPPVA